MINRRSPHEMVARQAIVELGRSPNPCASPVIEFINDGRRQGQYGEARAEALVSLARHAERKQRDRIKMQKALLGRVVK